MRHVPLMHWRVPQQSALPVHGPDSTQQWWSAPQSMVEPATAQQPWYVPHAPRKGRQQSVCPPWVSAQVEPSMQQLVPPGVHPAPRVM